LPNRTWYNRLGNVLWFAGIIAVVSTAGTAVIGINKFATTMDSWPVVMSLGGTTAIEPWVHAFNIIAVALVGLSKLGRVHIGDPVVWSSLKSVTNTLQEYFFPEDRAGGPSYEHRVTLFIHRRRFHFTRQFPYLRRQGWLIPALRSGHHPPSKKIRFRAEHGRPNEAEGVAGYAWAAAETVEISSLPDPKNLQPGELEQYASATRTSQDWVRLHAVARSFLAFPVHRRGEVWGVLVMDSPNADIFVGLTDETTRVYTSARRMIASVVSNLAEGLR